MAVPAMASYEKETLGKWDNNAFCLINPALVLGKTNHEGVDPEIVCANCLTKLHSDSGSKMYELMFGPRPLFSAVVDWVGEELRPRAATLTVLPFGVVQWLFKMLSESIPEGKFWLDHKLSGVKILFTAFDGMNASSRLVGTVLEVIGRFFNIPGVNPERHDTLVLLVHNSEKSYQFDYLNWKTPQVYPVWRNHGSERHAMGLFSDFWRRSPKKNTNG
jgi:hypothetical protein